MPNVSASGQLSRERWARETRAETLGQQEDADGRGYSGQSLANSHALVPWTNRTCQHVLYLRKSL